MRLLFLPLLCLLGLVGAPRVLGQQPKCVCLEDLPAARGLRSPVGLRHAGDGSNRRFVAEQVGLLWVVMPDGSMLESPYLNITEIVLSGGSRGDERGFLAYTFHPDYKNNGRMYILYSIAIDTVHYSRISELLVNSTNANQVDPTSERVLMDVEQLANNHNGGDLVFGTDDLLYIFTGDGGFGGDPTDAAMNKLSYLGKALRVDVDSRTDDLEYGIPSDNPYMDEYPNAHRELYAIGLRNPWRVTMDPGTRDTGAGRGRIYIGDVGQNAWEEIDILEAKGNFAWSSREGPMCYKEEQCGNIGPEVWPIAYYNHTHTGKCVISGYMYQGCMNPDLNGWFFFADYVRGKLFRMEEQGADNWVWDQIFTCATCPDGTTNQFEPWILSWGIDEEGETYFCTTDNPVNTHPGGAVYKIVDPDNRQEPCPVP